jgi:two-component system chemotaxis response regulator CheY
MGKTILIVDDSATMVMSIKTTLEMNGFRVETANDGVQALERIKAGVKPDLVITDIHMPHMGGMELIGKLKALPGFQFVPILTLTTESEVAKREEAKKLGAAGWLVKPVAGPDLIQVIKQLLPGA